jgi:hypothetical protein
MEKIIDLETFADGALSEKVNGELKKISVIDVNLVEYHVS